MRQVSQSVEETSCPDCYLTSPVFCISKASCPRPLPRPSFQQPLKNMNLPRVLFNVNVTWAEENCLGRCSCETSTHGKPSTPAAGEDGLGSGPRDAPAVIREPLDPEMQEAVTAQPAEDGEDNLMEEDICYMCSAADEGDVLVLCDGCDNACHLQCAQPPLRRVPKGQWYATLVQDDRSACRLKCPVGPPQMTSSISNAQCPHLLASQSKNYTGL
jgi:hypothetical protein